MRALTSILRQVLQHALLSETFAIASSPVRDAAILDSAIIVDQNSNELWPKANQLASPSQSRAVAIVDRTADAKLAARELVAARFSFGGSGPYAPDLVLVNEFVKQDFLDAVVDESRKLGSSTSPTAEANVKSSVAGEKIQALKKIDSALHIIVQEAKTTVVELTTRRSEMLETKIEAPVLTVHAVKSLDDAIDFTGSANSGPALAAYHFGNAQVGKYLAQFVDARVSLVNHIPRAILVGPAHPAGHFSDPVVRYTADMFSFARPAFIQAATISSHLAAALSSPSTSGAQRFLDQALSPLVAMKRKPGGGVGMYWPFTHGRIRIQQTDSLCPRFLRARIPHECGHDPDCRHQRDSGGDHLACEEWEGPVVGFACIVNIAWSLSEEHMLSKLDKHHRLR